MSTRMATFRPYDMSNSETDLHVRSGEQVEILSEIPLDHDEFRVFRVRFPDGAQADAFRDELIAGPSVLR